MIDPIDLTVLIPCLNEADTLAVCIRKAKAELTVHIPGKSSWPTTAARTAPWRSQREGARVVVAAKGYGNALMGGIAAARGRFISWVTPTTATISCEIAQVSWPSSAKATNWCRAAGCPSGGGTVLPGAMPFLHRWFGNPMFSLLARWWFRAPIHDIYCGMRGFTKTLYEALDQRCTGMEFATEMIIKASLHRREDRRSAHHAAPGRAQDPRPAPEDLPRRLAHVAVLPAVQPALAFLFPGIAARPARAVGYARGLPGVSIGRR